MNVEIQLCLLLSFREEGQCSQGKRKFTCEMVEETTDKACVQQKNKEGYLK